MTTVQVMLQSISDVKTFVNEISTCAYDVDLISGRYIVDAKSIMGIFSLDLTKPIEVKIHGDDCEKLLVAIAPFVVK